MRPTAAIDLADLLARRKPGHCLEAPFYTSEAVFERDVEVIFGRHWIYVGVEPDVPEPGDYVTLSIGNSSVILVRDDDMEVRAFHNVCRHRGARLLLDESGVTGNLVCPYHQWTYDLTGKLISARHMQAEFDPTCHSLKPVAIRNVAGLLFICLAENPPGDIDEMAAVMEPYISPHGVKNTKIAHQTDIVEQGNWKLTIENNRECYHCNANHPELTVPLFEYGFGMSPAESADDASEQAAQYAAAEADFRKAWAACGLPSDEIDHLTDRVTGFRAQRLPITEAGESQTIDTRAACRRLLGNFDTARLGGLSFWTQPNSWHHFMADHIVTFAVFPLAPDRTLLRTKWLVSRDAVAGVDYDIDRLTSVWLATNDQDGALVSRTQAGVSSPAFAPGPYSVYTEGLVEKCTRWYVERMREHEPA